MKNGEDNGGGKASTVEKRSVSGTSDLFAAADEMMERRMMTNFSEYVRALIRADLNGKLQVPSREESAKGV